MFARAGHVIPAPLIVGASKEGDHILYTRHEFLFKAEGMDDKPISVAPRRAGTMLHAKVRASASAQHKNMVLTDNRRNSLFQLPF